MTYTIIFAGGTGSRMGAKIAKQFLLVNNTPILVHTISKFNNDNNIDGIIIVTLKDSVNDVKELVNEYKLDKVMSIIPGGITAMDSQYLGLKECRRLSASDTNPIVLLHDGVRPLINGETIDKCINLVKEKGNAVTISPAIETIGLIDNDEIVSFSPREKCILARAPQCFYLNDLLKCHEKRIENNESCVDSASMMLANGMKLNYVEGPVENIKVTTMTDYILCKALLEHKDDNK